MSFDSLLDACRTGNKDTVLKCIKMGHLNVVELLLSEGASCDANTFQGERCLYGSLTDEIRETLKQHNLSRAIINNDFTIFLEKLYRSQESDFCFVLDGIEYPCHRLVLASRSQYFKKQLEERWMHRAVLKHPMVTHEIFEAVLSFIYTGQMQRVDKWSDLLTVARLWKLQRMEELVQKMVSQPSQKWKTFVFQTRDKTDLERDWKQGFLDLLSATIQAPQETLDFLEIQKTSFTATNPDMTVILEDGQLQCHQYMLKRSEYFVGLLSDKFSDFENNTIHIPSTVHQFASVLSFDQVLFLDPDTCFQSLMDADLYLLSRMVNETVKYVIGLESIPYPDVFEWMRTSWLLNLDRLEHFLSKYIAIHLETFVEDPEFLDLVRESAAGIKDRQETDTIILIDDLRFWIADDILADQKMALLESLLEKIGFDV
ncbi:hypothetical protein EDD86DRAFT_249945 [Gorgonomyces haynaldii]|nr:hypothetical protein EDD86DRAFT_249945 [Gorgonomyces haynaldii]